MRARSIKFVPLPALLLLAVGLLAQVSWHHRQPPPRAAASDLPAAPSLAGVRLAALGDDTVMAKLLMLWLQTHDNQPGISIPFRSLDYGRVEAWLALALGLDARGQYPLVAAGRVYSTVSDEAKKRAMLEFVYRRFFDDPDRRWPWLAHAAIVAKHELKDLDLAVKYAKAVTEHATGPDVPDWARDMAVVFLQDLGELEAATVLVGYLLSSGRVTAPHEQRYLVEKLEELERKKSNSSSSPP
jgi:hypothetical protein